MTKEQIFNTDMHGLGHFSSIYKYEMIMRYFFFTNIMFSTSTM
jgi:hypothetical protein